MKYALRQAVEADATTVVALLDGAASWLQSLGYDQWSNIDRAGQIARILNRDMVMLLAPTGSGAAQSVATMTVSRCGDADFWSSTELAQRAIYLGKLAVRRDFAGQELGNLLLSWARDYAFRMAVDRVRLDAWRTNPDLHRYYTDRGWTHVRTVYRPGRRAGALFELSARRLPAKLSARLASYP